MKKIYLLILICMLLISNCKKVEGPEGKTSLIDLIDEPVGTNCANGGFRITSGIDVNKNGVLDANEIQITKFLCNGVNGIDGTDGINGTNGTDGTNGTNGLNSLISVVSEPISTNCLNGGYKITSGIDTNSNSILDANEIQETIFICNGIDGGFDQQIRLSFGENFLMTSGTSWTLSENQTDQLINFNKNNYLDADSIIVAMRLATTNSNTKCFGELYNVTDAVSIANSQLESIVTNTESFKYAFSRNIFDELPNHEITLALRIKSEMNGTTVIGGYPTYIFIYRSIKK